MHLKTFVNIEKSVFDSIYCCKHLGHIKKANKLHIKRVVHKTKQTNKQGFICVFEKKTGHIWKHIWWHRGLQL